MLTARPAGQAGRVRGSMAARSDHSRALPEGSASTKSTLLPARANTCVSQTAEIDRTENAVLQYLRHCGGQPTICWLAVYAQAGTGPRNARSGAHAAADMRAAIRVNRPASTSGRPRTDEPPHRGPAKPGMPAPGLPDLVAITGQFHCPLTRGKAHSPVKACTSVVWLPVWLPNGRKGAGIRMLSFTTSMNRTYGLQ